MGNTASTRQMDYIRTLVAERTLGAADHTALEAARKLYRRGGFESWAASMLIERLSTLPRKATTASATVPALGAYRLSDGRIVRIVDNREKTRRYGKVWDEQAERWEYLPGLGRLVRNLTPLTLEEAEAFGVRTGSCAICGRTLTRADSIARGIGPVCAGKF